MTAVLETVRRVFPNDRGEGPLSVGPDRDGVSCVEVYTEGQSAEEYWGAIRLVLPVDVARLLAGALLKCADEVEKAP